MVTNSEGRRPRGYRETAETLALRRNRETTKPCTSVLALVSDQAMALGLSIMMALLLVDRQILIWFLFLTPALVIVARAQRGAEVMVHEASHGNLVRGRTRANRFLADLLAGYPVLTSVRRYGPKHLLDHHGKYGSVKDPCWQRYAADEIALLRRNAGGTAFILDVLKKVVPHQCSWWRTIGSDARALVHSLVWHAALWTAVGIITTPLVSVVAMMHWLVAWLVVLPFIRIVGEADEHDYSATSEMTGTYSSLGLVQRLVFHPHGDGYHAEHHRYPRVPHHQLRHLRAELLLVDPCWKNTPKRTRVLADPEV